MQGVRPLSVHDVPLTGASPEPHAAVQLDGASCDVRSTIQLVPGGSSDAADHCRSTVVAVVPLAVGATGAGSTPAVALAPPRTTLLPAASGATRSLRNSAPRQAGSACADKKAV